MIRSSNVTRPDQQRPIRLKLTRQILAAGERFDVTAVFLEGCLRPEPITIREMIVERFARNAAADPLFALLAPKDNGIAGIGLKFLIGKGQIALIDHAEHFEDRQHRGKLKVLFRLLQTRNGRRAYLRKRGQLLLRQIQLSSSADRFFDKNWPIDL